jgi:uncharacterized protein YjaG (DUF416 family)
MTHSFDFRQLQFRLRGLPGELTAGLALLAAERVFPTLQAYSRQTGGAEAPRVRAALDEVWRQLEEGQLDPIVLSQLAGEVYSLRPETEDNPSTISSYALDAAAAAWEAIQAALTLEGSHAASAAQLAYESVHMFIEEQEDFHPQEMADRASIATRAPIVRELEILERQVAAAKSFADEPRRGVWELHRQFGSPAESNIGLS